MIFSPHERRRYEQELVASLRRAEASEALRFSAEADLAHLALDDPLTGLPNRSGLTELLRIRLAQGGVTGSALAVLYLDLDHFKAVNDSLDQAAGDELLTVVADRLRSAGRESAIVARLSGDEFVVMDEFSHAEQVALFAQRVLDVLKEPVVIEGLEVVTSASIGAALVQAEDTPDRVLRRADIAMYRAKARGRGCWELHDAAHDDPAVNRLRLLGELRHGIDHAELRLHYQPRIDLRTGDLDGVEALVRWQHPTRGLLPPAEFIEVAESSGLIRSLGTWVLEEAIAQAVRWRATGTGHPPVDMAVNLSTRQLTDPHLVALVTDVLARHGLDPRLLTLEITETALMEDPDAALTALTALNELGVKLAIDDFGTGYASLTYLQRFTIDDQDRPFVRDRSGFAQQRLRHRCHLHPAGPRNGHPGRGRRSGDAGAEGGPARSRLPPRPGLSLRSPAHPRCLCHLAGASIRCRGCQPRVTGVSTSQLARIGRSRAVGESGSVV